MAGRPRFVLGVYDSGGGYFTSAEQWEQRIFSPTGDRGLAGLPINAYLNYYLGAMPIGPTRVLLDVLHRHGVMYLQTGNAFEDGSWQRPTLASPFSIGDEAYVRAFAQHPAALGYYIGDEVAESLVGETEQHHRQLKAWDPEGLTFVATFAGVPKGNQRVGEPGVWVQTADVLGTDPYPVNNPAAGVPDVVRVNGYPHFIVADFVSKLRAAVPAHRPVWAVLQFFPGQGGARMPTAAEMRAHAVMAIVEGAQGLWWWDIGNGVRRNGASPAAVAEAMGHLRELVTELAGLEPALLADPVRGVLVNSTAFADPVAGRLGQLARDDAVDWLFSRKAWYRAEQAALQVGDTSKSGGMLDGAANVRTRAMIADGKGYVFAYNYTSISQPATFTVPGFPAFEWHDTFEPYAARIYVISVEPGGVLRILENLTRQTFSVTGPGEPIRSNPR